MFSSPFATPVVLTAICIALLAASLQLNNPWRTTFQCILNPQFRTGVPSANGIECTEKPHQASWHSWFHPQRARTDPILGRGGGEISQNWNILYHLGGYSPWIEKVDDVVPLNRGVAPPEGCSVEQVHMMSRHAERYPTLKAGNRMIKLLERMEKANLTWKGDLEFFNRWEFFTKDPQADFEQLTTTGPFSGTLSSFTTGVRLRTRYEHLLSHRLVNHSKTNFWASDSKRVIDTARYFGAGFFGLNWTDTAQLHIIPETADRGADTLTPGESCLKWEADKEKGHAQGQTVMQKFRRTYLDVPRHRLLASNSEITFTDEELFSMQEMCGFETIVRGTSHWCDVFTKDEFLSFEYARDLVHYYRAGPGTPWGALMGWLWLNATTNLLLEGLTAGPFFFSFVHDGDITPMLTALDVFPDAEHLPVRHRAENRKWKQSQVAPMSGRVIFELLSCGAIRGAAVGAAKYVRININDGIVALPGCESGPGKSCPLLEFQARIKQKGEAVGDFRSQCGASHDSPERITFLRQ